MRLFCLRARGVFSVQTRFRSTLIYFDGRLLTVREMRIITNDNWAAYSSTFKENLQFSYRFLIFPGDVNSWYLSIFAGFVIGFSFREPHTLKAPMYGTRPPN